MAVRFTQGSPMEQFQAGASLAGPNPIGIAIKGMLDTVNQMHGLEIGQRLLSRQTREEIGLKETSAMRLLQEKARLFPPQAGGVASRAKGIAETGLAKLQRIRAMLNIAPSGRIDPTTGQSEMVIGHKAPISYGLKRPFLSPVGLFGTEEKELHDTLESTFDLLALLRTGTAGEESQVKRLRLEKNIGGGDSDQTILNRIRDMEEEFTGFSMGTLASPVDRTIQFLGQGPSGVIADELEILQ